MIITGILFLLLFLLFLVGKYIYLTTLNIAEYKQLLFIFFKGRWLGQRIERRIKVAGQKSMSIGLMIDRESLIFFEK